MAQIKFYKLSEAAMASKTVADGAIWFNKDKKTIEVRANNAWEKFAGSLVNDASWSNNVLTINKHDGSSIQLDFSGVASIPALESAINTLKETLIGSSTDTADKDTIYGAKAAAAAASTLAQQGVNDAATAKGVADGAADAAAANTTAIEQEVSRAKTAEDTIEAAVGLSEDGTYKVRTAGNYIQGQSSIAGEIGALDTQLKTLADSVADIAGGNLAEINGKITNLESGVAENKSGLEAVNDEIDAMDFSKEISEGQVRGKLVQVDGKITEFELSGNDIASAQTLSDYMTSNDQALADVKATAEAALPASTFDEYKTTNDKAVSDVAKTVTTFFEGAGMSTEDVNAYRDTLKELQEYIASDETAAGQMAANIAANTEAIGEAAADGKEATGLYKIIADGDAAVSDEVDALEVRVKALEDSTEVGELSNRVDGVAADVAALEGVLSGYTTEGSVKSAVDAAQAAATAAGTAAATAQQTAESKVASVTAASESASYITVNNTDPKNPVISVSVEAPAENATGLAKASDVYAAMSWVEFD